MELSLNQKMGVSATPLDDFSIEVATVNGSGSQTANNVLMRAIFRMGASVSGKNMFPSNISGLPTWFQIRVSPRGYLARKAGVELMICLNPDTLRADVDKVNPGGMLIRDAAMPEPGRQDVLHVPVPFQSLAAQFSSDIRQQKLLRNMIYVGVAARILHLDMDEVHASIAYTLAGKAGAIERNRQAADAGFAWAQANLADQDRLWVNPVGARQDRIIIDGNTACALGALFAGVSVVAWYPITPSTSLVETLMRYGHRLRRDPDTGRSTLAVIQMEDELASAGVVLGAGWAGARAMTATSGPGLDLMTEFIGYGYFAEIPGVFINVQRSGPSTGLPTRTAQSDIELCATCSHGDTRHVCLYPATMEECFRLTYDAFNLSERLQTPVFVVTDLDVAMQNYASEPFAYPADPLDRGKVLDQAALEKICDWSRYMDTDGDGICHRTLPGTPGGRGAYFTRGSGHNAQAQYTEDPEEHAEVLDRLRRKHETAKRYVPEPIIDRTASRIGLMAFGSSDQAVSEARDQLRERHDLDTSYLRLRAFPFPDSVQSFLDDMDVVYVVEQNRDAQMAGLLAAAFPGQAFKLKSVLHYDSLPLCAGIVTRGVCGLEARRSSHGG